MIITQPKILSLVLSLICVAYSYFKLEEISAVCILLLIPLGLIWFSEGLGSFKGYVGKGASINAETPPDILKVIGWIFLISIFVLIYKKNR
jgi:uncharacterized membrane protein YoaT (DUF817 family)